MADIKNSELPPEIKLREELGETGGLGPDFKSYEEQAGIITEQEKKIRELLEQSTTDDLTGLASRRGIKEFMRTAMEKNDREFSIMLIDIDHFKKFNDTYGHAAGDKILKWVAKKLQEVTRTGDVVGRWGGEEFVVVLPRFSESNMDLYKLANRYVEKLKDAEIGIGEDNVTISLGVTRYYGTLDKQDWERTLKRADQALYQAKSKGRNRADFINYFEAQDLANSVTEFKNV